MDDKDIFVNIDIHDTAGSNTDSGTTNIVDTLEDDCPYSSTVPTRMIIGKEEEEDEESEEEDEESEEEDKEFKPATRYPFYSSFQGKYVANYKDLYRLFGKPNGMPDGWKTTTEWIITDREGNLYTIYDYKATSAYDRDYPSVKEFRSMPYYFWHLGGSDCGKLTKWLDEKLNRQ